MLVLRLPKAAEEAGRRKASGRKIHVMHSCPMSYLTPIATVYNVCVPKGS